MEMFFEEEFEEEAKKEEQARKDKPSEVEPPRTSEVNSQTSRDPRKNASEGQVNREEIFFEEVYDENLARESSTSLYEKIKDSRRRHQIKLKVSDELNEVGVVPNPTPELLAERQLYENDYVALHQNIFKKSTGIKPFGQVQVESVERTHHALTFGGRVVIAEPRGFGKTTRTSNNALAAILQGKIRYAVILASSLTKANEILESIKTELVDNPELERLYPAVCACFQHLDERVARSKYQTYGGESTHIGYSKDQVRFPIIPGEKSSGSIIQVRSKDNVRGLNSKIRYGPESGKVLRPDFVFMDDIQTDEEAESPTTVSKIVRTIKKSVMFAGGHNRRISMVMCCTPICAGDVSSHYILHEPSWEVICYKMVKKMPDNLEMWLTDYARILNDFDRYELGSRLHAELRASEYLKEHFDEMHKGAEVAWEWAYAWDEDPQTEISALQHAMNFLIREGAEAFESECQCNVIRESTSEDELCATQTQILEKTNKFERFTMPVECRHIATHIDVNENVLTYVTVASPAVMEPYIIDYGTFPPQEGALWKKDSLLRPISRVYRDIPEVKLRVQQALKDFIEDFGDRVYTRADGIQLQNNVIMIDSSGRMMEEVLKVARESKHRAIITPAFGFYYGAKDKPISEKNYSAACTRYHHCVLLPSADRMGMSLHIDVNYFKLKVHEGWKARAGLPGSMSLFEPEWPGQHNLLSDHCTVEVPIKDFWEKENRTVYIWKNNSRRDNEYFDNIVNCLAGLCKLGVEFRTQTSTRQQKTYDISSYLSKQRKTEL